MSLGEEYLSDWAYEIDRGLPHGPTIPERRKETRMLNHIVIMGRLTKDPELRTTQSGVSVTSFTVAVDRDYTPQGGQKQTDFIDCVAWRQGGEFVSKYFRKGSMIVVSGRLESRKWTDRDGQNRTSWEIQVDHSYFGEAKRQDGYSQMDGGYSDGYAGGEPQYTAPQKPRTMGYGAQGTPFQEQSYQQSMYGTPSPYEELEDDGDLPF